MNPLYYQNYTGNIGVLYPYHNKENTNFSFDIENLIEKDKEYFIDHQSIIEIAMRSYILTNRTLIKGIQRQPYLSTYNVDTNSFQYGYKLNLNKHYKFDEKYLAKELINLLKEEVISYIKNYKKIGILLSGGMDSRILAGILRKLQVEENINIEVIAFNWGMENSRDRVYAKRIADSFGWEYVAYEINSEVLKENFETNLSIGCEISPVNLHAMKKVRDYEGVEIILAGSYGDTLGRASYNGIKIEKAPPIVFQNINRRGIIKNEAIQLFSENIKKEQKSFLKHIEGNFDNNYIIKELEYHHSHTRRYLSTAMSLIGQKKILLQLFTSPKVTTFLWSLPLTYRYGRLYVEVLNNMPKELNELPWSNTGKTFYRNEGLEDNYNKSHHKYGEWLRSDLRNYVLDLLESNEIYHLGIFNEKLLNTKIQRWKNDTTTKVTDLDQLLSWMANLSLFLQNNKLNSDINYKSESNFKDYSNYIKHSFKDDAKVKINKWRKL